MMNPVARSPNFCLDLEAFTEKADQSFDARNVPLLDLIPDGCVVTMITATGT